MLNTCKAAKQTLSSTEWTGSNQLVITTTTKKQATITMFYGVNPAAKILLWSTEANV